MNTLTQERLKEMVDYNPETGTFFWKERKQGRRANSPIGIRSKEGYQSCFIDGKRYYLHRLAILYVYGKFPKECDHVNHIKYDNRICNLRDVTRSENMRNKVIQRNNKSGVTGVFWNKRRNAWQAFVCHKYIGLFKSIEEAQKEREEAIEEMNFHKNHGKIIIK